MLSVKFDRFGKPAEVLRVEEVPIPEPAAGEVLVKLLARSINPSDLLTIEGVYGRLPQLPATPGYEGAGIVAALGEGVTGLSVGQRVIPLGVVGTWQEYVLAAPSMLIPTPEGMNDATAAQFVVNPLTAWIMVVEDLCLQPGEWLLQTAAGSALGKMVIQIAILKGFKTINVVRRPEQVEELKALGADEVICSSQEDIQQRVLQLTGGKGVRAAIDAVGGTVGAATAKALSLGGVMLVYGLLSFEPIPLDSGAMIFKASTVRGFWLSDWLAKASPAKRFEVIQQVLGLMASGQIAPPVEAEYPLKDIIDAVKHAERSGRHGKIILT